MKDAETGDFITIFIRATLLYGLGRDDGLRGVAASRAKLKAHRKRIEEAASEKYRAEGVLAELDGKAALWIEPNDLR